MFVSANGEPNHVKATTFDSKGWRINEVLIQLEHPAAYEGPTHDIRCSKCGAREASQLRHSIGGPCPADKRPMNGGSMGRHEWKLFKTTAQRRHFADPALTLKTKK